MIYKLKDGEGVEIKIHIHRFQCGKQEWSKTGYVLNLLIDN